MDNFTVGDWKVEVSTNRISHAGATVELEPRVMDLLRLLATRAGEVISKAEIGEAFWDEVHVNEEALTRCVFKLRKALNDDARRPLYIETVSKRGYRLIAAVSDKVESPTRMLLLKSQMLKLPRVCANRGLVLIAFSESDW